MTKISESHIETLAIQLLQSQGFVYLSPENQNHDRPNLTDVILKTRLTRMIDTLNPNIPKEAKEQAIRQVLNLPSQNLIDNNETFHRMLTEGIEVEYMSKRGIKGDKVWLIDYETVSNNEFIVCNQFTVTENNITKRPDVVLFVNGLPLVVIELKNPTDETATLQKAFTQLSNYKNAIPTLFYYNSILIASDGSDAKTGTISSDFSRFLAWKTRDAIIEEKAAVPQIETIIKSMLNKETLLDLIRHTISVMRLLIGRLKRTLGQNSAEM
jgi:type I restriction enzyme R subunit